MKKLIITTIALAAIGVAKRAIVKKQTERVTRVTSGTINANETSVMNIDTAIENTEFQSLQKLNQMRSQ